MNANTDDLVRWLGEQLDEDEKRLWHMRTQVIDRTWWAMSYGASGWRIGIANGQDGFVVANGMEQATAEYIVAVAEPTRMLRGIKAKRAILALHTQSIRDGGCQVCDVPGGRHLRPDACTTVRMLATVYADRPGYREAWRP